MLEGPRRRVRLAEFVLIVLTLIVVAQLVQVQVLDAGFYRAWAAEQRERRIMLDDPPRGVIRDRNGHLLAGNVVVYSVEATPSQVLDPVETARVLEGWLHTPRTQIQAELESDKLWVLLAPQVSKEIGDQIAEQELPGITVRPRWARAYPEGSLAAHVLGFCNVAGEGFYGVEGFHDMALRPRRIEREGPVDLFSQPVPWTVLPVVLPESGDALVLSLDRTIQAMVEQELAQAVMAYQADGGTIIVMDTRTFEILAMASLPNYDPGRYQEFVREDLSASVLPFTDPAISEQYEPGSVFKVLTVAAALDAGVVSPETTYYDPGWMEVGGVPIHNSSPDLQGEYTVADILIHSLNVGAAWLSTRMGADTFYHYLLGFGVGQRTGVDLAGEATGQVWTPNDYAYWHDANLGTNAFGQGVAVTPLQMITAVATVANGGERLRPYVVARRIAPDGTEFTHQRRVEAQVISPEAAQQVAEIMVRTVDEGIPEAQVAGYRVAGKTGTAQIPVPGGYDPQGTIASFVGFGPWPEPQVVILVKLDRPRTSPWASHTAAPTFQRVMTRLFGMLRIPPQDVDMAQVVVP